jgi:hypothetical protein
LSTAKNTFVRTARVATYATLQIIDEVLTSERRADSADTRWKGPTMKRFVVLPGGFLFAICLVIQFSLLTQGSTPSNTATIPTPSAEISPGQTLPYGTACMAQQYSFENQYCFFEKGINLRANSRVIKEVSFFTYTSGLTVGTVMLAWGTPIGANYRDRGVVWVYWPDRYAYVLAFPSFNPNSRVGFIAYGEQDTSYGRWRGFMSHTCSKKC